MLAMEWQRGRRECKPLSLILGDVDSFKLFNDAYGHQAGDECLKAVARAFQESLHRPADMAARYGGEEFACLLPETDEAWAQLVAKEITAAMRERRLRHEHSEVGLHVTVSLGVATAYPALHENPAQLIQEADRRMYLAKRRAKARAQKMGADRA